MLIHFQAFGHNHRAIWKFANREALHSLRIGVVVMEARWGLPW
jgi:hypothetical protein